MKIEKIILSIVAIIFGLIAAAVAFYLYQMTKTLPAQNTQPLSVKSTSSPTPTPTKESSNFLTVENPKEESVSGNKTVKISGKTMPDASIVVSTENSDQVVTPASNGDFSLNETLADGTNMIQITAVFSGGEEKKVIRTVTYSKESF